MAISDPSCSFYRAPLVYLLSSSGPFRAVPVDRIRKAETLTNQKPAGEGTGSTDETDAANAALCLG